MHPNPAFRQTPAARNIAFAREVGFGMLCVNGPEGPIAAHVPFHLSPDATWADLHLARSNPIARAGLPLPALIAIQGPDAYISPDWYGPHEQVPDQVPTWNYIAVHLRGTLHPLPAQALEPHVDALTAEHEARLLPKTPWTSAKMTPGAMPRMMRMILPFRLEIHAIEGTWKLNQNKPADVRTRAATALSARDAVSGPARIAAEIRADLAANQQD
jgi:transcriptional regulator